MSKTAVIVNPGFVVRTPGFRFTEGQRAELDAHQTARLLASGDVRLADGSEPPQAPQVTPVADAVIADVTEPVVAADPPCESEGGEA